MISTEELELLAVHDDSLITPVLLLEKQVERKGFTLKIAIVEGELQISISHKYFPIPVFLIRKDIREMFEDIIKPLGLRIKRWFTRGRIVKNPVFVLEAHRHEW